MSHVVETVSSLVSFAVCDQGTRSHVYISISQMGLLCSLWKSIEKFTFVLTCLPRSKIHSISEHTTKTRLGLGQIQVSGDKENNAGWVGES